MPDDSSFAPFRLERRADGSAVELGRGAMGITYKATDTQLGRAVALKVIHATWLHDATVRQRFLGEARAAAQLQHANVAGVFQLRAEGEPVFYAMEFVEGETVEAFAKRTGPLPPRLALRIVLQAAQGLAAAHERGLIHRDIKPANLMLARAPGSAAGEDEDDDGLLVKVIDFGLAKQVRGGSEATTDLTGNNVVGTPSYMSPEQISSEGQTLDGRSDIYSLGVTLWYLLAGRVPFEGSHFQVLSQHMHRPPPVAQLTAAGVPAGVVDLMGAMLAKDRDERPESHAALVARLRQLLKTIGSPAAARPLPHPSAVRPASSESPAASGGPLPGSGATSASDLTLADSTALPRSAPRRWSLAWGLAAALLVLFGAAGWLMRGSRPAVVSEAEQWRRQARELVSRRSYTREELAVAEGHARRATELEPNSAAAWSTRAVLSATYLLRLWDRSEQRLLETESFANRALALNPDEPDAFYAIARLRISQGAAQPAEEALRRAVALRPEVTMYRRSLATSLVIQGRQPEAKAQLYEAIRRDPRDNLTYYDLALTVINDREPDAVEGVRLLDVALAIEPYSSARLLKARILCGQGEIAAARAEIDQLPASDRGEERAVYVAMWVALLERRLDRVLETSALTAKAYFEDLQIAGPKAWLVALAYAQDGKESLARLEWQTAESTMRQRLHDRPGVLLDQARLGITLAWLGRTEQAAKEMAVIESAALERSDSALARHLAYYYAALGEAPQAVAWIRRSLAPAFATTPGLLPIHPFWMKLRGKPEFEALIEELKPRVKTG